MHFLLNCWTGNFFWCRNNAMSLWGEITGKWKGLRIQSSPANWTGTYVGLFHVFWELSLSLILWYLCCTSKWYHWMVICTLGVLHCLIFVWNIWLYNVTDVGRESTLKFKSLYVSNAMSCAVVLHDFICCVEGWGSLRPQGLKFLSFLLVFVFKPAKHAGWLPFNDTVPWS